jgi:DNA replication protein DnaC
VDSLNNQLKRIATGISKASFPTSSTTDPKTDPDGVCPICGGLGFVTRNVPVEHPDFGKSFPCVCQRDTLLAQRSARLRALSNLDVVADKTFETFALDLGNLDEDQLSALRAAYEIAWTYAQDPQGWLFFQGTYGSGKTHLAVAIANYRLEHGESALFTTVPDLLDHLRSTYGPASETEYDDLFERVRNAPLLVLDDLGAESSTPWAQEKLFQLINHRYLHKLCTVITTNVDLDMLDPRIRSRLVDQRLTRSVTMPLPDFRREIVMERSALTNLGPYAEMVFETFDLREDSLPENERRNLRQALEVSRSYAEHPQDWLLFVGAHGCGKTHLAAAIANYRYRIGEAVILVTAPDLLDYLRAAFHPSAGATFSKRFYEIRDAPLLVIDQLDLSNASPWALEKIRQIADHRYLAHLPTVFTTTQALENLDPLLRSRIMDRRRCKVFAILAPDYSGGAPAPRRQTRPG